MSPDRQSADVQTLTADTLEDCRIVLGKRYGSNYDIIDRQNIEQKYGLFGLLRKPAVKVWFVSKSRPAPVVFSAGDEESQRAIKDEILRRAGKNITDIQIAEISNKVNEIAQSLQNLPRPATEERIESIDRICELLEDNEFTKEFISGITARLKKEFSLEDLNDFAKVERQVIDWIGESIQVAGPKAHRPPRVVVIVGPTGVGKTTTIGKLAAQNVMRRKKTPNAEPLSISLITIDKTRIGAEDQLKILGEVLELQVRKAENAEDLKTIFDSIKNLRNIMQNYEPFGYSSVIVTKCDETTCFGNIISVLSEKRKAISYFTDGQVISRNIQKANVVDFLIRLSGFTVDRIHIEDKFGEK